VVTGDTTQVDVPDGRSGLAGLERVLAGVEGLGFVHLGAGDVVRHKIVADIVAAYEKAAPSADLQVARHVDRGRDRRG
jgi:phosphate starvation-inducible PhoH-like protein